MELSIDERISLVDEILGAYESQLGKDRLGYTNHVYRMIHFCFAQGELTAEEKEQVVIAACFHDLGIWTAGTFDYIPPSIRLAIDYLEQTGLQEWIPEIEQMIDQHHKLRQFPSDPLTEVFRKGDLVDFSLGIVKCGIPRSYVTAVKSRFPNAGFHKYLAGLAARWICRHPLNPVPVLKW